LAALLKIKLSNDADYDDINPANSLAATHITKLRIDRAILKLIALKFSNTRGASEVQDYNEPVRGGNGIVGGYNNAVHPNVLNANGSINTKVLLSEILNNKVYGNAFVGNANYQAINGVPGALANTNNGVAGNVTGGLDRAFVKTAA